MACEKVPNHLELDCAVVVFCKFSGFLHHFILFKASHNLACIWEENCDKGNFEIQKITHFLCRLREIL